MNILYSEGDTQRFAPQQITLHHTLKRQREKQFEQYK